MFTLGVQLRPIVLSLWALQAFATGFHPSSVHASFRHVSSRRQAKSTPVEPSRPGKAGRPGGGSRIKVRLISLGAGYDIRSIKLMERKQIDEAIELDLPEVVEAKTKLFTKRLLKRRRSSLAQSDLPTLISVDLNKIDGIDGVRKQLEGIVCNGSAGEIWHNIFVFEGVMIYLDKEVPSALLRTCSDVLNRNGMQGSLCFADRLENVPEGDRKYAEEEMARNGWQLNDWLPKPGLARHMGSASLVAIK